MESTPQEVKVLELKEEDGVVSAVLYLAFGSQFEDD